MCEAASPLPLLHEAFGGGSRKGPEAVEMLRYYRIVPGGHQYSLYAADEPRCHRQRGPHYRTV